MFDFDELDDEVGEEQEVEPQVVVPPKRRREVEVEGMCVSVCCCPLDRERVPAAVLICPGHHGKQFGSSHMESPLLKAIAEALDSDDMPHVRFNYSAVDKPDMQGHGVEEAAKADVEAIVNYMLANLCDRVYLVGYSLGSNVSLDMLLTLPEKINRFVALSVGTEYWRFCSGPDRPKGFAEQVRRNFERHAELTQPALYVCGTKDSLLNMAKLKYVLSQRSDKGKNASIEILEGGQHDLGGHEEHAARLVAEFVVDKTEISTQSTTTSAKSDSLDQ